MSKWTLQQENAIKARDTGLIISAAAGSGKTSVLVERLAQILSSREENIPAHKIIVATFTNDAAYQMKQKLENKFNTLLEKMPEDEWILKQQSLLRNAKISTIHSFCFDLIRENIHLLDIATGFRILDDREEKLIVAEAIESVFESVYSTNENRMKVLSGFFCKHDDNGLLEIVEKTYKFLLTIPFSEDWIESTMQSFSLDDENVQKYASEQVEEVENQLKKCIKYEEDAILKADKYNFEKAVEFLNNEKNGIDGLCTALKNRPFDDFILFMKGFKFERFAVFGRKLSPEDSSNKEKVTSSRDSAKGVFSKILENVFSSEDIKSDLTQHGVVFAYLCEIVTEVGKKVWEIKLEKNALTFSDAETLAVELLAYKNDEGQIERTELAKNMSEYYEIIMLDEFQDVNNLQELIFNSISRDGRNIFSVGDVKQAIYRFRNANPEIFIKTMENSVEYDGSKENERSYIKLNKNFRSSIEVVDFVNAVFGKLMSKACGEVDYSDNEELVLGANYKEAERTTEVIITEGECKSQLFPEAICVAKRIKEMLDEKHLVYENGKGRPCTPKDFSILLRRKLYGKDFVKALEEVGVKAYAEEEKGYLKAREISILINLLKVVDNPLLDIPLLSVALSPMFMLTDEDIARVRIFKREGCLYNAIREILEKDEGDSTLLTKISYLLSTINELRLLSAGCGLEALVRIIYDRTDFMSVMQAYSDGEQKKANLRYLLSLISDYEQNSGGALSGFLRYINSVLERNDDFESVGVVSGSDDVVAVKTIHKSKGLEFPFVFVCDMDREFGSQDTNTSAVFDMDLGAGFKIQNRETLQRYISYPFHRIARKFKTHLVHEEQRLFYVALTRAKEKLFIVLENNDDELVKKAEKIQAMLSFDKDTRKIAPSANSYLDWLFMVLMSDKGGYDLCNTIGVKCMDTDDSQLQIKINSIKSDFSKGEVEEEKGLKGDKGIIDSIKSGLGDEYDYTLSKIMAKLTVSEIVKSEKDGGDIALKRPKFIRNVNALTGAEKGTATHTFMQYCNFDKARVDVKQECISMVENGYLSKAEGDVVDIRSVARFFSSELFGRMQASVNLWRERKFLMKISDMDAGIEEYQGTDGMIQGIADCVFEEDDGIVVVDYKTDYVTDESELIEHYGKQLKLYKYALEKIYNKSVKEILLYSFRLGKTINIL